MLFSSHSLSACLALLTTHCESTTPPDVQPRLHDVTATPRVVPRRPDIGIHLPVPRQQPQPSIFNSSRISSLTSTTAASQRAWFEQQLTLQLVERLHNFLFNILSSSNPSSTALRLQRLLTAATSTRLSSTFFHYFNLGTAISNPQL